MTCLFALLIWQWKFDGRDNTSFFFKTLKNEDNLCYPTSVLNVWTAGETPALGAYWSPLDMSIILT